VASWTIKEPTTLTFDMVKKLRIKTVSGTVDVVGADTRPTLEVTSLSGKDLEIRLDDDGYLDIGYLNRQLRWSDPIGWITGRGGRTSVNLSVAVPPDCDIDLDVVSVTSVVSGIDGPVRVNGVAGDVTLARLADVEAGTISGSIEAERISGTFAAKTVSGSITAAGLSGRAAIAETVSGAVALDVEPPLPTMHLTTVSGDATVRVPHKCDLEVRLTTTSGQVASSFAEIRSSAQPGSRSADGTIGAGGPRLRAHTVSGHVTLLRRDDDYDGPGEAGGDDAERRAGPVGASGDEETQ
jgi:hypothetical protein